MPSAAFSAQRCRLSDIDGLTAAVSASASTESSGVDGQGHRRDHLDCAKADHRAAQDRPVVSGSVRSLISPSVSDSITARGFARIRCLVTDTGVPSTRA